MLQSPKTAYVPALGFNWLTPCYDAVVGATTRERSFKGALPRQANIKAGQQVLDLASGTGTLAIWLKQRHPLSIVTGLDGGPAILSIATRKAQKSNVAVKFDQGLSHSLPYPAEHYCAVRAAEIF